MKLQSLISAPITFGLIIGSFPLINSHANAKNVNAPVAKSAFYLAMDANEDSQNEETPNDTEVSEEPNTEEVSNETEVLEESPDTDESQNQNPDSEDNLEETEVVEESSNSCPEGKSPHPRFGTCISDWMNRSGEQDCIDAKFGDLFSISQCRNNNSSNRDDSKSRRKPDLLIRKITFPKARPRNIRVLVSNVGNARAKANILRLTIRRIKGKNVRRKIEVVIPSLRKNQSKWITVKARNILPNKVRIINTKFSVNVDASKVIKEKNENNNVYWHNR
ncbi:MAG: hypothetical protein KI793_20470 [Rivularia sp. (in: Bacteria)]|nr:hypothetical protein [Rivularia sp. MS3]